MRGHTKNITGSDLTLEELDDIVADSTKPIFAASAQKSVKEAHLFVRQEMRQKVIYGVNTGFGPMASHIIGRKQLGALQKNLIRSHATGIGAPIEERFVRAAMVVRLNTLARGASGVSTELIDHLLFFVRERITPLVPEHGAVGTSGDLVQLAHIALALIGEGDVLYKNVQRTARSVLAELKQKPYSLKPKEGLSLINGTSVMTGIAAMVCLDARRLISLAIRLGACALELVHGLSDSIDPVLHSLRPHRGQLIVAHLLRDLLGSSKLLLDRSQLERRFSINDDVYDVKHDIQDVYSLRCSAQILGPVLDSLHKTEQDVSIEMNSVTDNPIVDVANKKFLHGGNFHGDCIAASIDQLKIALVKLTMLSERRTNFFLHSRLNRRFPPFLNLNKPGLTLGLQGLQFVATSTTAQSQTLAFPQYIHSIPTNADNQDVVSMGTDAALIAAKVAENALIVLTIEAVVLTQAIDFLGVEDELSVESQKLWRMVRGTFSKVGRDRALAGDLARLIDVFRENALALLDLNCYETTAQSEHTEN